MTKDKMNIGALIKYHRRLKGLTQSELSQGICSVTHLSKFENYNKEVNEETVEMLLSRLDISPDCIEYASETIAEELENLLDAILSYDKKRAGHVMERIEKLEDYIMFSNYIPYYHLYLFRYYVLIDQVEEAEKQQEIIRKNVNSFTAQEREIYEFINAVLCCCKGEYKTSLDMMLRLESNDLLPSAWRPELYYYLAFNWKSLNDYSSCIAYGHKALNAYLRHFTYLRVIHTQFLLGLAYTNLGLYENASEQYRYIFNNMSLLKTKDIASPLYSNYAYLLGKAGQCAKAAAYYEKAMEAAQGREEYLESLGRYTELLISNGDKEKALSCITEILNEPVTDGTKKQQLLFKYYQYELKDQKKKAMAFLEDQMLPYLEKMFFREEYAKFAIVLAEYYVSTDKDKSLAFYKQNIEKWQAYSKKQGIDA